MKNLSSGMVSIMERLTDDKVADNLKENIEGLQAIGYEPDMSNLRYVRLNEYERTGYTPEEVIAIRDETIRLENESYNVFGRKNY